MATLNVILHGLFSVHERPNDLVVYLPRVDGVHVYRAGHWLAETELGVDSLHVLRGVENGLAGFDATRTVKVKAGGAGTIQRRRAQSVILMPKPKKIWPLRAVPLTATDLIGSAAATVQTASFPTVHVLEFEVEDMSQVRLDGHPWQPPSLDEIANLHIVSEEEVVNDNHALDAFRASADVLGIDLLLAVEKTVPKFDPQVDLLPPGVLPMETEDLVFRLNRLRDLGQILQGGVLAKPDAQALAGLKAPWANGDPAGTKIGSCALLVGD